MRRDRLSAARQCPSWQRPAPPTNWRAAATSTGILNYQWQINNGNTGGNTNQLWFAPLAFANYSTNYKVIVTDGFLTSTSAVATVTPPLPTLVSSPTGKAVPQGLATSLTGLGATYSGRTNYQWQLNGSNVSGANYGGITSSTLTIASMQTSNAGPYQVTVNDGFNSLSLTSAVATLTIAVQPTMASSVSGTTLNLTFPSEVGPQYVVEWKGELTNGVWTAMSTNVGTGLPISVGASMLTPPQRFFRVRMQ